MVGASVPCMRYKVAAFIALTVAVVIAAGLAHNDTLVGVLGLAYFASLIGLAVTVR